MRKTIPTITTKSPTFSYVFGGRLSTVKQPGLGLDKFIEGVRIAYGISDAEYVQIQADAEPGDLGRQRRGWGPADRVDPTRARERARPRRGGPPDPGGAE